ncbi:dicarboxylate/amino acid:cation symporter [Curvibacter gracilis]|uniref:dicarboxylate/amino acid:cation symporter n=1 Tax=Curvibacter gracilis TaxID=230310 RepID=UPI0009FE6A81|nr:dicarboxylate/amino acid:cation symporter [Curvibacter gracilis]
MNKVFLRGAGWAPRQGLQSARPSRKPWYRVLYIQVLLAMAVGIVLGHLMPGWGVQMKPLGDGFIKLVKMVIAVVIFCTIVSGIASMQDLKSMGRTAAKAMLYFEVVSTIALLIGLGVANWLQPGAGLHVDPATLNAKDVMGYAGQAKQQSVVEFLLNVIPHTLVDAFAKGDILQVVLVAVLCGVSLSAIGERGHGVLQGINGVSAAAFALVNLIMKLAPLGAFGAIAFTVARYGLASLGPLLKLIGTFYLTSLVFVVVVLGAIGWWVGFSIFRFLAYIKEEILLVLGTSSSDAALPSLMQKLEALGLPKSLVGLVVPTGYTFNTDGTSIYMTLAALFVAQAMGVDLSFEQQLSLFLVAALTSKGASGVQGAAFIALVGTLSVVPTIPVAGMALILGIDRFMSEARALVNMIGNGVATLVLARWNGVVTREELQQRLRQTHDQGDQGGAP